MDNIRSLTGVRGFAALWVVLMHYTWGNSAGGDGIFYHVLQYGFAGVIVFLVLSGFILSHVYSRAFETRVTRGEYLKFLYRRVTRIYPVHLLTLLAFAVMAWIGYLHLSPNETIYTFVLNVFLVHAWGFTDQFSWNNLSWTISVEMFVYLLIPFMIFASAKLPKWALVVCLLGLVHVISQDYFRAALVGIGVSQAASATMLFGMYLFIFSAVVICGVVTFRIVRDTGKLPSWAGDCLALVGIAIIAYGCTIPMSVWVFTCGAILLVAGLFSDQGFVRAIFGNPVSVFLGEISYSLYLTHFLVNVAIANNDPMMPLPQRIIVALLVATAVHYLIDQPIRGLLRGRRPKAVLAPA